MLYQIISKDGSTNLGLFFTDNSPLEEDGAVQEITANW